MIRRFFGAIWRMIKSNWVLKIMAVIFAVILWSYVLAEENPIRQREIPDVSLRYSQLDELEAKDLAISGSLSDILESVDVRVEVKQNDLKYVSNKNIIADVDLSTIKGPGEHKLDITATSPYGKVLSVSPSQVTLVVDNLDQRNIPVTVETTGTVPEGYHAMTPVIAPEVVYIRGASVDVEKAVRSVCHIDLNGLTEDYNESVEVDLLDKDDNVLDKKMFAGIQSVIVNVEVLAKKTVSVNTTDLLIGKDELAEGYEISEIIIEPGTVDIIGKKDVLNTIYSAEAMPIVVTGADKDIVTLLEFKLPEGVSILSEDKVQAIISIREKIEVKNYNNVEVQVKNLAKGLKASLDTDRLDIVVIAGTNQLSSLFKQDIIAYVDLDGLEEGTHEVSIQYSMPEGFTDENISSETKKVTVTITK